MLWQSGEVCVHRVLCHEASDPYLAQMVKKLSEFVCSLIQVVGVVVKQSQQEVLAALAVVPSVVEASLSGDLPGGLLGGCGVMDPQFAQPLMERSSLGSRREVWRTPADPRLLSTKCTSRRALCEIISQRQATAAGEQLADYRTGRTVP